ncbi:uncharacterized protein TNCV_4584431 [Trichonephila clavipes]|nr:uncharacterized protein TNCV_4584431 [Trichonephila clavipes]
MDAVDFLQHENSPTWTGVEPVNLGVLPQNWGGNEPNRTVTCMVLKATANDRRHLTLYYDEFCEPRSGLCRSSGISNNNYN